MIRAVIDTNVFFSALGLTPKHGMLSAPAELLLRAGFGHFTLVTSEAILAELEEVLLRKLAWDQTRLTATISRIRDIAEVVNPQTTISECRDPDDDRLLEAALEGRADHIVSGDKDLLVINPFRGIGICTVNDFLSRLDLPHPQI